VSGTTVGKVGHAFGWLRRYIKNNGEPVCRSRAREAALLANSHILLVLVSYHSWGQKCRP